MKITFSRLLDFVKSSPLLSLSWVMLVFGVTVLSTHFLLAFLAIPDFFLDLVAFLLKLVGSVVVGFAAMMTGDWHETYRRGVSVPGPVAYVYFVIGFTACWILLL